MIKRTEEISKENFPEAVNRAYALNKRMHTNTLAQKIVFPIGSILFTLHALILSLGVFCFAGTLTAPNDGLAFNSLPFVLKYWNAIWGMFGSLTEILYIRIILMVLYLFLVPFVICSIIVLILSRKTKVKAPEINGNPAQQAKQLYDYLQKSPQTYFQAFDGAPVVWRRVCGIVSGILVIVFWLYSQGVAINQSKGFLPAFKVLFGSDEYSEKILLCVLMGVLFYVPFYVLNYIFTKINQPYFNSYVKWKKFTDKVECYWVSVDKVERDRREREEMKKREERKKYSSTTSSNSSSASLSYEQKFDYINKNFDGEYSFSAIERIENDPSLSPSEKDEMKTFLRAFGD
ncbi:MAG: hypothetical protein IJ426_03165 [Clostridia bacterium]|nr:hypothetical protein [Clostridia bacterium]